MDVFAVNGTMCDDGDACTDPDTCDGIGNCVPGSMIGCDDTNSCTDDICDITIGCVYTPLINGTLCDDGDACTTNDTCSGGTCIGTILPPIVIDCGIFECLAGNYTMTGQDASFCDDDMNECTQVLCDMGICVSNTTLLDGALCDDGKNCTLGDICMSGDCIPGVDICPDCIVRAGSDAFTVAITDIDFSIQPIPTGFFGPGSDPFTMPVSMVGDGVNFIDGAIAGNVDTIVERKTDANLMLPGGSDTIDIEIVALSLRSIAPITVTFATIPSAEMWNLDCQLSPNVTQPLGTMQITASNCTCDEGGLFTTTFINPQRLFCILTSTLNNTLTIDNVPIMLLPNVDMHWYPESPNPPDTISLINNPTIIDPFDTGIVEQELIPFCGDFYPGVRFDKCNDTCELECYMNTDCDDGLTCTTDTCVSPGQCFHTYDQPTLGNSCYTGPIITRNVGICRDGVLSCEEPSGAIVCKGEITPLGFDMANDGVDTDCDGMD